MSGAVHDIITHANFCEDRLRGFGVARGRILAFSIDLLRRLYNTLALPCQCVMGLIQGLRIFPWEKNGQIYGPRVQYTHTIKSCSWSQAVICCPVSSTNHHYSIISRDLTTRHQIKQIATGWTSVGPRKNRTCWTISELNPDSTAALIVACSFSVQSAILSALTWCPYSRGSTTAATARTKTRTGRRLCQQRQLQERRNRHWQPRQQPRTTVAKCASWRHVLASHWCRADIEHVDSIQGNAMTTKKTFRNWSISQSHNQSLFHSAPKRCPESWPTSLPHVVLYLSVLL